EEVRRELQVIKDDLRCNAVRISGNDLGRLFLAASYAMEKGLEVWFSPTLWDRPPEETLQYLTKAAEAAEILRQKAGEDIVFVTGGELTLFMQGILEGRTIQKRIAHPSFTAKIRAGEHNKPLNEFLARANHAVRSAYHGRATYASLVWEQVDWCAFDFVGVDHYRSSNMEDRYVQMLEPALKHSKPVVVTEFGYATTRGGIGDVGLLRSSAGLEEGPIDQVSQYLHYKLPLIGRFIRPRLNGEHIRDEAWQAQKLVETLGILDKAGVDGAFVSGFISQITPYSDEPRYDLDMASSSLVKYFEGGPRGSTHPDMPWEPKESFRAVAEYYASH
ncbi:MAG TPA: hypothetical protein VEJ19_08935, partial [Nitrososphaerales archaeon]|nr:hypothetical protein [Nitrososphaerales archaeon]